MKTQSAFLVILALPFYAQDLSAAEQTKEELIKFLTELGKESKAYYQSPRELRSIETMTFEGDKLCVRTESYTKGVVEYYYFYRVRLQDLDPNRSCVNLHEDVLGIEPTGIRKVIEHWDSIDGKWVRRKEDNTRIYFHSDDRKKLISMENALRKLIVLSGGKPENVFVKDAKGRIVGSFDGKYIKDANAKIVGSYDGKYIKDANAKIVGGTDGLYFRDMNAKIVGSFDGIYIKDANAKIIGSYEADGSAAGGLLLLLR